MEVASLAAVNTLLNDMGYALRYLRKAPGFTAVALLTLALGVGSTMAMFTVVNGVLLRPLPFDDPERLVAINEYNSDHGVPQVPQGQLSFPDFEDIAARNHSLESVGAYSFGEFTVTGLGPAFRVQGQRVSHSVFDVLHVRPSLGREFLAQEDQPGHDVVILSHRFWRVHFNADPRILGSPLAMNGTSYTIVGVMPEGFQFAPRFAPSDIWITYSRWAGSAQITKERGNHSSFAIARLKPGFTLAQANSDLASIARGLAAEFPNSNKHTGIAARPEIIYIVGDTRKPLLVLMGAVGLVLLIACGNVANLLLARGAGRAREISIRAAVGATRLRIVRQLIVESLLLAGMGAALGTVLAAWAVAAVLKLYPSNLPRASEIAIDPRVLLFTALLAVITGILFGLIPALRLSAPNLAETMRQGGTFTRDRGHNRLRAWLVIAETALGVTLLIGAGLLIRSFQHLSHVELGFNPYDVLTANFDLTQGNLTPDQMDLFIRKFLARIRSLPGVTAAAASMPLPLGGNDLWSVGFNVLDHPVPESEFPSATFYLVTDNFFQTMQVPLLHGRFFDDRDLRNSKPVMIITQSLAQKFFPGEDPIGRKIFMGAGEGKQREQYDTREIVGVVGDIRTTAIAKPPAPAFYVPIAQMMWGEPTLAIRTNSNPAAIAPELKKLLTSMNPDAPLYDVRTVEDCLGVDLGRARFQTVLLGIFASLALLMTAVGLYGLIAYTVEERTHEIGVRVALGASSSRVLGMVLRKGLELTAAGIIIGVLGALAITRVFASLLYEVRPKDPITYLLVCVSLSAVALLASYVPAMRATRVDPVLALRRE